MLWLALGALVALLLLLIGRRIVRGRSHAAAQSVRELRLSQALAVADAGRLVAAHPPARAAEVQVREAASTAELRVAIAALLAAHPDPVATLDERAPCFFSPRHGPASSTAGWAPQEGADTQVPVCAGDAERLARGEHPDVLTVRDGDFTIPWFAGGWPYDAYAEGYFTGTWSSRIAAVRQAACRRAAVEAGDEDRVFLAPSSRGGLGEAPGRVHHRLGQLASGQQLDSSRHPTIPRRR